MNKVSQDILLLRAEKEFLNEDFRNSLISYGLILKDYPSLDEAKIGVYLSDLGLDNAEEAQILFDYYQIIKDDRDDAVDVIDGLIESFDKTKIEIKDSILTPMQEQLDYGDGIRYSDFLLLIENRGSFKNAFEDIMFSTKVIITEKDEFIDFVTQLSNEGFYEMALNYLDATTSIFGQDQDVLALYSVVKGVDK
ncbi:hypothetical protein MNB_SV-5-1614 [hydrothermal vent metagenome]|uniref:Uncharacterized protein n=1 Tax=hydrothermal vent metagenome TaxID=652676 RepID=A0A1W1ED47_9ZZZZ